LRIYADASFLVSLYSPDGNSVKAARAMQAAAGDRFTTTLGELEVVNALHLRVFRKELTANEVKSSLRDFESDLSNGVFQLCGLSERIFERAHQLSRRTTAKIGTRAADLLHVAAALELVVDFLYTFDEHQRKLARAVHLKLN
jgi:predicted nucleic acid-binding protein